MPSSIIGAAVGGLITGGLGLLGADESADAQVATANSAQQSNAATLALQKQIYEEGVARNKPFYDLGVSSIPSLKKMVTGNYTMQASPAARYELQQGTTALNRQLAARGLLGSGNAAQRLATLSSGIAAKDYNDQYNRLLDQIKVGTGASAATGNAANTYNSAIGAAGQNDISAINNAGNARAALYSGYGGLANNAINTGMNLYNSSQFSNLLNGGGNTDMSWTSSAIPSWNGGGVFDGP